MLLAFCRPDFEVTGLDTDVKYEKVCWQYEEANDILGLNPNTTFPRVASVGHLSGNSRKNALNMIRQ